MPLRLPSLWLLLSSLSLFGLFIFPYMIYSSPIGIGKDIYVTGVFSYMKTIEVKDRSFPILPIVTVLLAIAPLLIMFLFKNRKLQLKLILGQMILIGLLAIWMWVSASGIWDMGMGGIQWRNIGIGYFLLPISVLFLCLAVLGIRKDERSVRSADTLP